MGMMVSCLFRFSWFFLSISLHSLSYSLFFRALANLFFFLFAEPLPPGLYRALYAFEPEGLAEMRLVEDQIVRVVGRHGQLPGQPQGAGLGEEVQVGWAVVVRDEEPQFAEEYLARWRANGGSANANGSGDAAAAEAEGDKRASGGGLKHALVPESYIEAWRLDGEEWDLDAIVLEDVQEQGEEGH
jgi:hypothetical protein